MTCVVATAGVDFFRVDRSGATRRLLIVAGALVSIGATSIGAHLVSRVSADVAHVVSLVGGLVVLVGLILGFGAMAMLLFENVYLLIEQEGVRCHENGKETVLAWADLAGVSADAPAGVVVFARNEAPPVRWFAGKNAKELAARLDEARRKALHGLLRSDPPRP